MVSIRAETCTQPYSTNRRYTVGIPRGISFAGNFPELSRVRVLLPESFIWFRLSQICTFGAHGSSDFPDTVRQDRCSRSMMDD
jgi:hypothetical protein